MKILNFIEDIFLGYSTWNPQLNIVLHGNPQLKIVVHGIQFFFIWQPELFENTLTWSYVVKTFSIH